MQHRAHGRRRKEARGGPFVEMRERGAGFTLIELLISMSIILILAVITLRLVGSTLDNDRIKTGSRELQSYLAGARDRAIYAGQPRGVRFIPDQADPYTVRSFVYIGAPTNFSDGQSIYVTQNSTTLAPSAATINTLTTLVNRGVLLAGAQITLGGGATSGGIYYSIAPDTVGMAGGWAASTSYTLGATVQPGNGHTYVCTVAGTSGTTQPTTWPTAMGGSVPDNTVTWTEFSWALTKAYAAGSSLPTGVAYTLQLAPAQLPSEQPRALPQNIVIDLRTSILPVNWQIPGTASSSYDVLFSPAGTVFGPVTASGRIHFVLADIADTTGEFPIGTLSNRFQLNAPWQPNTSYIVGNVIVPTPSSFLALRCTTAGTTGAAATQPTWPTQPNVTVNDTSPIVWQSFVKKANLIVSLATATGRVTTHPVDVQDILAPGYDTFRYAEIGEVTQ